MQTVAFQHYYIGGLPDSIGRRQNLPPKPYGPAAEYERRHDGAEEDEPDDYSGLSPQEQDDLKRQLGLD